MALSTADAARLAQLKTAYDQLITGKAVASVSSGGRTVTYTKADMEMLKSEIDRLEALAASPSGRSRGAVRFRIG